MKEETLKKLLIAAVLLLLAALSFLLIADRAADANAHAATYASIDGKTETVLKLSASAAILSGVVSAIPGDTATPIAEKLADFTEYFLLILCVLYTEKYLVTILGIAAFRILIPVACVLAGLSLIRDRSSLRAAAIKIAAVALAVYLVIPASLRISDMIYRAYEASIQTTIETADELTEKTSSLAEAEDDKSLVSSVLEQIKETAGTLTDKAADTLNRYVETMAVMIVTSCVIPLLVLLFFLWLVKQLTGLDLAARFRHRTGVRRTEAAEE